MEDKPLDELSKISARLVDYVITAVTGIPVPIATLSVNSIGVWAAWRASNFAKNLAAFMREPSKLDPKIRKEFEEKLGNDKTKFMNEVFQTIDQIENEDKSEILGKVFSVHVAGKIDQTEYRELSNAIRDTTYADLIVFTGKGLVYAPDMRNRSGYSQRLTIIELLVEKQKLDLSGAARRAERLGGSGHPEIEYQYQLSDLGNLLTNIVHLPLDDIINKYQKQELLYMPFGLESRTRRPKPTS